MKKLVIIGGGFAGSFVARSLEKKFDLTLVDSKNYFEFTPGILRTIVNPRHMRKIQVLHEHYLDRAKLIVGEVREIRNDFVILRNGKKVNFDYLVVASGSSYSYPIKEKNLVNVARAKHLKDYYKDLCEAKEILVVGGGLVGVELAAEILGAYRGKNITLVHSHSRLVPRNNVKSSKYSERFLKSRGVEIIFNERVTDGKKGLVLTDKGRKIKTDIVFLCTGIKPNSNFMRKNFSKHLDEKNQIKVNKFLQVDGTENIFSIGDVNSVREEKTAQNAECQAKITVKNICALEKGGELCEYNSRVRPLVISLGKYNGMFEYGRLVIRGLVPAFLKWFIERREMMRFRF